MIEVKKIIDEIGLDDLAGFPLSSRNTHKADFEVYIWFERWMGRL